MAVLPPFCDGLEDFEAGPLESVVVFVTVLVFELVELLELLSVLLTVDAEADAGFALDEFGAPV